MQTQTSRFPMGILFYFFIRERTSFVLVACLWFRTIYFKKMKDRLDVLGGIRQKKWVPLFYVLSSGTLFLRGNVSNVSQEMKMCLVCTEQKILLKMAV